MYETMTNTDETQIKIIFFQHTTRFLIGAPNVLDGLGKIFTLLQNIYNNISYLIIRHSNKI
jgi:hypothetical protein